MAWEVLDLSQSLGLALSKSNILEVLRAVKIASVASRPNVAHFPGQQIQSMCLGLSARSCSLTFPTQQYPGVFALLTQWLRGHEQWRDFQFTSITINKNHAAALHRDKGNSGLSVIVTLGNFRGGELRVFPDDDLVSPPECFNLEDGITLQTEDFALFDGNFLHGNHPFYGERFSVIFFTSSQLPYADDEIVEWLKSLEALR